jgi:hypothetical protein
LVFKSTDNSFEKMNYSLSACVLEHSVALVTILGTPSFIALPRLCG